MGVNLNEAAEKGYVQTVEYLVGEGASVDEKDEDGMYFNRSINFYHYTTFQILLSPLDLNITTHY